MANPKDANKTATKAPKQDKEVFVLFNVVDAEGNVIPNAKLSIVVATRNARTAMEAQAKNKDVSLTSIKITK